MPLLTMAPDENVARSMTLAVLLIQAVLVIASIRLLGVIGSVAVVLEVVIVIMLVVGLGAVVALTGSGTTANLFSQGVVAGSPDYFAAGGGLMAGLVMGLVTLVGFDSAANLAEEAKDPFRSVPRAIVGSVVASAVLGFLFVVTLTVAIKDVAEVSASASPVAAIINSQLGPATERVFLAGIAFAMFGAGMVMMASYARSRLRHGPRRTVPRSRRVSPGQSPHPDPGGRDGPHLRCRRRVDGGASGRGPAATDRGIDDSACGHLRRHHRVVPVGAQTVWTLGAARTHRSPEVCGRSPAIRCVHQSFAEKNTAMNITTISATGALLAGLGMTALGAGAGFAHAESVTITPGGTTRAVEQVQPPAPVHPNPALQTNTPDRSESIERGHRIPIHGGLAAQAAPAAPADNSPAN